MSRRNIFLIDHEPYSTRRRELFYIDELRASGYNVAVWDISQLVFPGMKVTDEITESYLKKLSTITDLKAALNHTDINDTIFIVECISNWKTRKIFLRFLFLATLSIKKEDYTSAVLLLSPTWCHQESNYLSK